MKIEQLADAVKDEVVRVMRKSMHPDRPNLAVYIDQSYYRDAMSEARGEVTSLAYEMYDKSTILGFPIFLARPANHNSANPPMYSIVEL